MYRTKRAKIEKIEEEDEMSSSMMQSCQSTEKRDEVKKKSILGASILNNSKPIDTEVVDSHETNPKMDRETFKSTDIQPLNYGQTDTGSELSKSDGEEIPQKMTRCPISIDVTKSLHLQKAVEVKLPQKKNGFTRKLENPSNYKVNSISLLNMLQNKTLNLIKNEPTNSDYQDFKDRPKTYDKSINIFFENSILQNKPLFPMGVHHIKQKKREKSAKKFNDYKSIYQIPKNQKLKTKIDFVTEKGSPVEKSVEIQDSNKTKLRIFEAKKSQGAINLSADNR